jgi:hypothetical protein
LKEKGDNVIALAAGAGLLFGVFNIAGGLYKMSFGIKD